MMKCGLLGRKLSHSYSPLIHSMLGDYDYRLYEAEPDQLEQFIKKNDLTGFNVTIPYKKDVIPYLDELSNVAKKLGAVNTVIRRPDGTLWGHNTDYFGFRSLVEKSGIKVCGRKVLVLGSGGASNTAFQVLSELGAQVVIISRSGENDYRNIRIHKDASVIVNTTPVGMYPAAGLSPVSLDIFDRLEGVIDVIYNPSKTKLILDAEKRGIPAVNGLWMLVAQAKEAAEWFSGTKISASEIGRIDAQLRKKMRNIVLIGMPGCGKTTLANLLADRTGKEAVDADTVIQEQAGKPIPRIFAEDGEAAFRELETHVLKDLGQRSGIILSTGGGCVTRPENLPLLRQNGTIFWIQRQIQKLPTDGRPLSQSSSPEELFRKREAHYQHFADIQIGNDGDILETVDAIMKYWEATE